MVWQVLPNGSRLARYRRNALSVPHTNNMTMNLGFDGGGWLSGLANSDI